MRDNDRAPDTLQWWIAPAGVWRIKTFALDHDIHTHFIGSIPTTSIGSVSEMIEFARARTQKHYGNAIASQHVIELLNCTDEKRTDAALLATGLEPRLEIAAGRFAFWKPDDGRYYTQSEPR